MGWMRSIRIGRPTWRKDRGWRKGQLCLFAALGCLAALVVTVFALDHLYPLDLSRLGRQSTLVTAADGTVLRAFAAEDGAWRYPVDPAAVDPKFRRFLTAYEDQ